MASKARFSGCTDHRRLSPIRVEGLADGPGPTCHALGVLFIGVKSTEGVRGAQQEETWPFGEGRG